MAEARTHDSDQAMRKLTTVVDGHRRIISDPPTIGPDRGPVRATAQSDQVYELLRTVLAGTGAACSPTAGTCWSSSSSCRWPARS